MAVTLSARVRHHVVANRCVIGARTSVPGERLGGTRTADIREQLAVDRLGPGDVGARSWDTVARGLADRLRVLTLDQRGHGEFDWSTDYHELRFVGDVAAYIDALGLERLSLVGFAIGGSHTCTYALLYPKRVERLVLFECLTAGDEQGGMRGSR